MSLLDKASLIVTPNGYKESKLYSVVPSDASGDLAVTRATTATRVNSSGLIESVSTNAPRIDYSNGSCPSLLVEPQRTNLLKYSNDFTNGVWTNGGYGNLATVTPNNIISPDGTMNGSKISFSAGATQGRLVQQPTVTSGVIHSVSVYLKKGNKSTINISCDLAIIGLTLTFNFDTLVLTNSGVSNSSATSVGNGWYLIKFSYTAPSTLSQMGFLTYNGEDGYIYCYGFQTEVGSYSTSYIPTVASSVTRNADVISKTGINSLIGQTEGTFFLDIKNITNENSYRLFTLSNSTNTSYLVVGYSATTNKLYIEFVIGSSVINIEQNINRINGNKIAFVYANGVQKIYVDGINTYSNNLSTTTNGWSVFKSSYYTGTAIFNGNINSIQLYKTALTDAECITLTTL